MRDTVCYLDGEWMLVKILEEERMKPEYVDRWRSPSLHTFLEKQCGINKASWLLVERTGVISPVLMKKLLDNKRIKELLKKEELVEDVSDWLF
jgi:hypothetical protein